MNNLQTAAQQALEILERLHGGCTDSDDGTVEAITVWCPEIIDDLRAALAEPGQKPMATLYGTLPIYDTAPKTVERVQEPVAQLHPDHFKPNPDGTEWCREVLLYSPNNEGDKLSGVNTRVKLYAAPPQRKPLTEEEIDGLMQSIGLRRADDGNERMANHAEWERRQRRRIARAVERAHGI